MQTLFHNIITGAVVVSTAISTLFAPQITVPAPLTASFEVPPYEAPLQEVARVSVSPAPAPTLGSTNAIESAVALFETSLASSITSSATSMTLVSGTTKDGSTLASSTYGFVLDEGTASSEFVKADCTATACTNMDRGISALTGTTSVTALKFAHRRGATVKITTAPLLIYTTRILNGIGNFPNALLYSSSISTSSLNANRNNIPSVGLLQDTAFSAAGLANANTTQRGLVQLGTDLQVASSTTLGSSGAAVVIAASSATSTYNSATAALKVVVTQNSGKIDPNFLSLPTTATYATSSLTVGAFPSMADW
jgi:hypothetical protein